MSYTILDHLQVIDDFINEKESFRPSEFGAVAGVHFDNRHLDGHDMVHVSKAEKEVAVFLVHFAFKKMGSTTILLKGTKGFREIIEGVGIGYFDEWSIRYSTGSERVRNFVVGKLCMMFGVNIQDLNEDAIDEHLIAVVMSTIREETRSKFFD